jgi:formylglycine-generating enzyme required for sulfatase activity
METLESKASALDGSATMETKAMYSKKLIKFNMLNKLFPLISILALLSACSESESPPARDEGAIDDFSESQSLKERNFFSPIVTEQRLALVIGNSNYPDDYLPNPRNDAGALANILPAYGFTVIHKQDLNQEQMEFAIIDFGQRLSQGGVGLFYFGGHGIQIDQHNYLVPIGPQIQKAQLVKYRAIDAQFVVEVMQAAGSSVNIVILDACRDNPYRSYFRSEDGLAAMKAPRCTIISYATAVGQKASEGTGRSGLFAQHLLKAIQTPGLTIEEVFKKTARGVEKASNGRQVPWRMSSLTGDFCLTACAQKTVDENKALLERVAELEQRLAQASSAYKREKVTLQQQVAELQRRLAQAASASEREKASLQQQVAELQRRLAQAASASEREKATLQQQMVELQQRLAQAASASEREKASLQQQMAELQQRLAQAASASEREKASLQQQMAELQQRLAQAASASEREKASLQQQVAELQRRLAQASSASEREKASLQQQVAELQRRLAQAASASEREKASLQQQVAKLQRRLAQASSASESEKTPLVGRISELEQGLAQASTSPVMPQPLPSQPPVSKWTPGKVFRDRLKDGGFGPEMVVIPAGRFQMGDIQGRGRSNEKPVHWVSVDKRAIGRYEVTHAEFVRFLNAVRHRGTQKQPWFQTKAEDSDSHIIGSIGNFRVEASYENHPVIEVSWYGATAYAQWLSQQTGQQYRLPTEAEWEYAARAGTTTSRYWGNDPDEACRYANVADETVKRQYSGWTIHNCTDGYMHTAPVGRFKPNAFGLFDIIGNVWEWACSEYESKYRGKEKRCIRNNSVIHRVVRGGSWFDVPGWARVPYRNVRRFVRDWSDDIGFRLVRITR